MTDTLLDPALLSPPPDKPAHRPYPELAQAIRSQADRILDEWRGRTLFWIPELGDLTAKEFKDDIARILSAMADALESNEPPDLRRLVQTAPAHGFQRFMQAYDLADLFAEERVLRRVIVARVEDVLRRRCTPDESAALHGMIDIMLQQGVLALVQQQRQELQRATELQLKHLSFLSHDLGNNLFAISCNLEVLGTQLAQKPEMRESVEVLGASLAIIRRTRDGMRRLLEHERLRSADGGASAAPVELREVVEPIVKLGAPDARAGGLRIEIGIPPGATACTNADLLTIVLQNLIGNAVKHAHRPAGAGGSVRIAAERGRERDRECWILSVADDGPGIPADRLDTLFNAFQRLPKPGESSFDESGFGLGLAIAAQAARLLDTKIGVDTQLGRGSRFWFTVPAHLRVDC